MIRIIDFLWPLLAPPSPGDKEREREGLRNDIEKIRSNNWGKDIDVLIEEARRLHDLENDRRKTADTKAGIYLAAVGAIAPIYASLASSPTENGYSNTVFFVYVFLLFISFAYLFSSGLWAFRALKVSTSTRVDIQELLSATKKNNPKESLVKDLLISSRSNRKNVNDKVTKVKMTDAFLIRTFFSLTTLLLMQGLHPHIENFLEEDAKREGSSLIDELIDRKEEEECKIQIPMKLPTQCLP